MVSRRSFLQTLAVLGAEVPLAGAARRTSPFSRKPGGSTADEDLTQYVDVRIGTGGHGHTYPGATVPFGAVQLSPDTYTKGWDWCSGYYAADTSIMGFTHTHLSGTGCGDLLDVLLMPNVGAVKLDPGTREHPETGYRSRFAHEDEHAEPGYYSVVLRDRNVLAELTATERTGLHRYTFPAGAAGHFILDLGHAYDDPASPVASAEITLAGDDLLTGGRVVNSWGKGRHIYFAAQFSRPFQNVELARGTRTGPKTVSGPDVKAVVHFDPSGGKQVLVRVGISGVSTEGALNNLRAEQPHWDFDRTRRAAKAAWQRELSRVRIETGLAMATGSGTGSGSGEARRRTIFYTALYHMMLAPTLFDDVDGSYRGMDGAIHTLAAGEHNYSSYSLWDTFRALHPAFTLMQPERVPAMVNCLVTMAEQSPQGMPVWPLQGEETGTMTGYHSASVIAEACAKNFPGVDWARAYKVMRKRNMLDDYRGLAAYRALGYIPADKEEESVSKVLEYGYNDWACSRVAERVGARDDAALQRRRSQNYRHLFDPQTQFIRGKLSDGAWTSPFDPIEMGHTAKYRDYTESNAWQTTFGVQHDVKGYMQLWGGREAFRAKLDQLFTVPSTLPADAPPDIAGMVGQYAHGNEPSHHIAYLYVYAGQPWKTQARVRSLLETMYRAEPDGLEGNEDCGQMSAWYVMSALGLYAVDPASATYVLTAPLFERAVVQVSGGHSLTIEAKRPSPEAIYVQSVLVNGRPSDKLWVTHEEIAHGGSIVFTLGTEPNLQLGTGEDTAPPSLTA